MTKDEAIYHIEGMLGVTDLLEIGDYSKAAQEFVDEYIGAKNVNPNNINKDDIIEFFGVSFGHILSKIVDNIDKLDEMDKSNTINYKIYNN